MAPRYMLDTNISSAVIKGNIPAVRAKLRSIPMTDICVSAVTAGELLYGAVKRGEKTRLAVAIQEFLLRTDVLPWDQDTAVRYGAVRAELERNGKSLGNLDMMIAAHALAAGAVMVTNDQAFRHVVQLELADWTKP